MKIRRINTQVIEIPFHDGGKGQGITPQAWRTLETVLVRVEDEDGCVGWGEAFGYFTANASKACIDSLIAPSLVGSTIVDIAQWNLDIQLRLHLFGRYGITQFAISGVDIALWDLYARRQGLPLHRVLGDTVRERIPAYASLVRYADPVLAADVCRQALAQGFRDIKLHEITVDEVTACRRAVGDNVPLSTDLNCAWTLPETLERLPALRDLGLAWLEEPVFPPEDFAALASLRGKGVPISAGENWCTAFQFQQALNAQAVDSIQPSVTKAGGISACLAIGRAAQATGTPVLPHCPYFGPGFYATLHLAAVQPSVPQVEYLYVQPEAWLSDIHALRQGHLFEVPTGPGSGFEPDAEVVQHYCRA